MKRGRKQEPGEEHDRRGTRQVVRHGPRTHVDFNAMVDVVAPSDMPQMPAELSTGAQLVWNDNVARAVQGGFLTEKDQQSFATYCEIVASCNACFAAGAVPPAAYLAEQRKYAEMFGLMGAKSRVKGNGNGEGGKKNPFASNGSRRRPT
jgi:hypothetical protein